MISPTGSWIIRSDGWGDGGYGARRRKANGKICIHNALDFKSIPGQTIVNPFTSEFVRTIMPYADNQEYLGGLFKGPNIEYVLFYFRPTCNPGETIKQGEVIGIGQDISLRYPEDDKHGKMITHIHYAIRKINPLLLVTTKG